MWEVLAKQRQRHMRLVTSAAGDKVAKRLKVKDEEMKSIWVRNMALQDQLRVAFRGDDEYEVSKLEAAASVGRCKGCVQDKAIEVLLPCMHLCVCAPCAATARACPACGCAKTGSICVYFS
ncbi:hypothetical protein QYE76_001912 [Lolium multiflorum]|uniref:RING-type domain-containing protein n=1 Tax=Lolium multiflorum TaxID=4521 RepID=A0AAD8RNR0_LOLMU|nr:hypothetical protein QYE76_001912 [Lolium multiflorum]